MTLRPHWMEEYVASVTTVLKRLLVDWEKISSHDGNPSNIKLAQHFARQLQSADFVMTTVAPTTGFYFYQAAQQMKTKCNVDLSAIAVKLSTQLLGDDGLLHLPTDEQTPDEQVSLWNPVMDAVGPVGEQRCNNTQYIQLRRAMNNFQICTRPPNSHNNTNSSSSSESINTNDDDQSDFIHNMLQYCGVSSLLANSDNCTEALVSDNRTLHVLQDLYQYPDKYCKCSSILRKDLPSCFVSVADMIDPTTTAATKNASSLGTNTAAIITTLEQAHQKMKFSLGFFKSTILCAVDLTCHAMNGWCIRQIDGIERCLAQTPGCKTGTNLSSVCAENDIFTLPYQITQGKLPDVCLKAMDSHNLNRGVVHDFANFVETCQTQEWQEKNVASSSSQHKTLQDARWLIQFTCIVGLIVISMAFMVTRRWLRRAGQEKGKQRFNPNEVVEQEELHELQSMS